MLRQISRFWCLILKPVPIGTMKNTHFFKLVVKVGFGLFAKFDDTINVQT